MKREHRHDLQTNELGKFTERVGTFLEVHGNRLMIGICVASLAASGIIWWVKTERANDAASWRELWTATESNKPEDFKDVWNAYPGTTTALWARVHEGESRLALGVPRLFDNVEAGTEELKKARDAFQAVVDSRKAPAEARQQALFGLARSQESLSDTTAAVKTYQTLISEFPSSLYKGDAEERVKILEKGGGQEFYAWFSSYPRPKVKEKKPRDRAAGDEDGPSLDDEMQDLKSKLESSGLRPSGNDTASPTLPESDSAGDAAPDDSDKKPDSTPPKKPEKDKGDDED